eukprot:CAMPEP_0194276052 /NCGR_PEP_ID=MMETSP0169-20130528/8735_1 /TAXON_ID=218684 /ORGANISM="Corethron pennatum, Strain L29A3" /LENGTH=378 /DNA_ID=CAMNT_0039019675 /DNA_START=435 /DNA_END=1571 /DNA_ORIENTATION=-
MPEDDIFYRNSRATDSYPPAPGNNVLDDADTDPPTLGVQATDPPSFSPRDTDIPTTITDFPGTDPPTPSPSPAVRGGNSVLTTAPVTAPPAVCPTGESVDERIKLLAAAAEAVSGATPLDVPGSPQNRALQFLLEESGNCDFDGSCGAMQRYISAVIYYALDGDEWKNNEGWLGAGVDECDWFSLFGEERHGLRCDENMCIREIHLGNNTLSGEIPTEINKLDALVTLNLGSNNIVGTIPEIGNDNLVTIDLDNNGLVGTIPPSVYRSENLSILDLDNNSLGGNLNGIGNATSLTTVSLFSNLLTGAVPTEELDSLQNLVTLYIDDNNLTGAIGGTLCNNAMVENMGFSEIMTDCVVECSCCTRCRDENGILSEIDSS